MTATEDRPEHAAGQSAPAAATTPTTPDSARDARARTFEGRLMPLLALGALIVVAGVAAGLILALHAKVTSCGDGHYFPPGTTDFRCYAHPHAVVGGALVGASVFAGVILAIIAVTLRFIVTEMSSRDDSPTSATITAEKPAHDPVASRAPQ